MNKVRNEANIYYILKSCPAGVGDDKRSSGRDLTLLSQNLLYCQVEGTDM